MTQQVDILDRVRAFVTAEVGPGVSDDTDIIGAGLVTSLFAMELVTFVEESFAIEVESDDLEIEHFSSIANVSAFVASKLAAEPAR